MKFQIKVWNEHHLHIEHWNNWISLAGQITSLPKFENILSIDEKNWKEFTFDKIEPPNEYLAGALPHDMVYIEITKNGEFSGVSAINSFILEEGWKSQMPEEVIWLDNEDRPPSQFECICDRWTLINCGCKCGAFKAEMAYKARIKKEAEDRRLFS